MDSINPLTTLSSTVTTSTWSTIPSLNSNLNQTSVVHMPTSESTRLTLNEEEKRKRKRTQDNDSQKRFREYNKLAVQLCTKNDQLINELNKDFINGVSHDEIVKKLLNNYSCLPPKERFNGKDAFQVTTESVAVAITEDSHVTITTTAKTTTAHFEAEPWSSSSNNYTHSSFADMGAETAHTNISTNTVSFHENFDFQMPNTILDRNNSNCATTGPTNAETINPVISRFSLTPNFTTHSSYAYDSQGQQVYEDNCPQNSTTPISSNSHSVLYPSIPIGDWLCCALPEDDVFPSVTEGYAVDSNNSNYATPVTTTTETLNPNFQTYSDPAQLLYESSYHYKIDAKLCCAPSNRKPSSIDAVLAEIQNKIYSDNEKNDELVNAVLQSYKENKSYNLLLEQLFKEYVCIWA